MFNSWGAKRIWNTHFRVCLNCSRTFSDTAEPVSLLDSSSAGSCKIICCYHFCGYCYRYGATVGAKGAYERCSEKPNAQGYSGGVARALHVQFYPPGLEGVMHTHWPDALCITIINSVSLGRFSFFLLVFVSRTLKGDVEYGHAPLAGGFAVPPVPVPWDQGCACLGSVYILGVSAWSIITVLNAGLIFLK